MTATDPAAPVVAPDTPPPPDRWAVVELMGHRRYVGRLTETDLLGVRMPAVEHHNHDGTPQVVLFRAENVYAVTITTEAAVRAEVERAARCYAPALPPAPYTRFANEDDDGGDSDLADSEPDDDRPV